MPGDATGPEPEHLSVAHEDEVLEIPSDGEADGEVEPPAPSRELAVVGSSAGPSSGFGVSRNLVWPCPGDPRKAQFILHNDEEVAL